MSIRLIHQNNLLAASLLMFGLVLFAVVSVSRSVVEPVFIVGDLETKQLGDLKDRLAGQDLSSMKPEAIQQMISGLPWVHHATLRRNWPSGTDLEVNVEEVIAYWNDDGFISEEGKALYSELLSVGDIPHLYGPAGSEQQVMEQYLQLGRMLGKYGHEIKVLSVTGRGAWSIETEEGVKVLLGKENLKSRVQRFLLVIGHLQEQEEGRVVVRMDARYLNGVAVAFADSNERGVAGVN